MILVDGMNVTGSRPDGWWRDRGAAMARLVAEVDAWAAAEGRDVTVVLDGRERDLGQAVRAQVRFAPVADDLLAQLAGPGDTVVTADRELVARAQARGAEVLSPRAFLRALGGS